MSADETTSSKSPPTLEEISGQLSKLKRAVSDLSTSIADPKAAPKPKDKSASATILAACIAAFCSLVSAGLSYWSGSQTAKTTSDLTRITTLQAEAAKADLIVYQKIQFDIGNLERDFETFLYVDPKTDPHQSAADIDQILNSGSFGSNTEVTNAITDFYSFIGKSIVAFQKDPALRRDADSYRQRAREKQKKAQDALDHWLKRQ
jgi:hypothetical protein